MGGVDLWPSRHPRTYKEKLAKAIQRAESAFGDLSYRRTIANILEEQLERQLKEDKETWERQECQPTWTAEEKSNWLTTTGAKRHELERKLRRLRKSQARREARFAKRQAHLVHIRYNSPTDSQSESFESTSQSEDTE